MPVAAAAPACISVENQPVSPRRRLQITQHRREGVSFVFECVHGMKKDRYGGTGAILADDMGLGKTLQSITLMYSLLKNKDSQGKPLAKRCIGVCPCSLVKNWEDEFEKWINSKYDLGVPACGGAFTSFKRVVSRNDGSGWSPFRF